MYFLVLSKIIEMCDVFTEQKGNKFLTSCEQTEQNYYDFTEQNYRNNNVRGHVWYCL